MATDLLPFVNRLQIVTKDLRVVPLGRVMNYAQHDIIQTVNTAISARRPARIITLKARQIGISTIIEGLMFSLAMILRRMGGLVVSHEADSAKHLLKMTDHYWETWPFRDLYTIKHSAVNHMGWVETGSTVRIATAKNVGAGRSQTIQFLHGSEVAFWDDPLTLMTGLAQSIPDTHPSIIAMESTANGIGGYFYDQWNAAVDGDTEYVPLFFPWHKHPQYTATDLHMAGEDDVTRVLGQLNDEERVLRALGISDERLIWRRWQIRNKLNGDVMKFHQEYPTTPEEAFVSTGTNIFPDAELAACYQPMAGKRGYLVESGGRVRFQLSLDGPLTIFREPGLDMDRFKYMIAGDATRSITGDFSCGQVLNRRTWEQVAVWHAKIDPNSFGDQLWLLGRYYNWAMVCPEIQGAGDSTISRLIARDYPFLFEHRKAEKVPGQPETVFGWWSGVRSKQEAVGNLLRAVIDGATPARGIVIHHHQTYAEMRAYESDDKGGFRNGSNEKHDDTVTALAIAITCVMYEAPNIDAALGTFGSQEIPGQAQLNKSKANLGSGYGQVVRLPNKIGMGDDNGGGEAYGGEARPWEIAQGSDEWEERMGEVMGYG